MPGGGPQQRNEFDASVASGAAGAQGIKPMAGKGWLGLMRMMEAMPQGGIPEDVQQETFAGGMDPMMGGSLAMKGLKGLAGLGRSNTQRMAQPTLDVVENIPTKQVMPSMDDANAVIGDMQRQMARVPQSKLTAPPPMPRGLGAMNPEFTPVGMEEGFNAGMSGSGNAAPSAEDIIYSIMMNRDSVPGKLPR